MEKNITKFSFLYDEKEFSGIPKEEIKTSGEKTVKTLIYKTDDGLEIERRETEFAGFDAVYTETVFKNNTDCESKQISKINDIDITIDSSKILESPVGYLPFDTEPMVWYNKGSLCQTNDFALATNWIRIGRDLTYKCEGGRSSNGTMPFFTYTQENEGYIIALGWSGQWRLIFSRNKENVFIKGGIEYCDFSLAPHESVRTMSAIILHYTGDMEEGQNAFRRLLKNHFSIIGPSGRAPYGPLAAFGWGELSSEKMIEEIDSFKKHNLGIEYYWVDAGWYGEGSNIGETEHDGDWSKNTGNWKINPKCHPDGFLEVTKKLKEEDMKFLLWFEPERVVKTTPLACSHPEMMLKIKELIEPWYESYDSHLLNLGMKEAWDYCFNMLSEKIENLAISCLRIDFNINPLNYWLQNDKPKQTGKTEILYINGLYRLWDALLEKFPKLIIDNCASGGRRIDIEMTKRSMPMWRSDCQCQFNMDSETAQMQTLGLSRCIPFSGCGMGRTVGDTYHARSNYGSSLTSCFWGYASQDFSESETEKIEWVRKIHNEYKRVRPYYSCDFYRLIDATVYAFDDSDYENPDASSWTAYQFDRPEENDGLLGFFRRRNSPFDRCGVTLKAIDENAKYSLEDLDNGENVLLTGLELKNFTVTIPEKRMSKLYIYKKIEG